MDKFCGTFKWEKDENLEEAMKAMDVPEMVRNMIVHAHPTRIVKDNGDGSYTLEMPERSMSLKFKLGEETEHETPKGKHKMMVKLDGDKLSETRTDLATGKSWHFYCVRDGNHLIMTMPAEGVTGKRYFKKE